MAKKKQPAGTIQNRRASFDYELGDGTLVGIVLSGKETKALRMGHGHLRGAYVTVKDGELWLFNATITSTQNILLSESEQTQSRKLLAKKKEIAQLIQAKEQGKSIVPTALLVRGRYIKLRIAVGRGKKNYDKRQTIKQRDTDRDTQRALRTN